MSELNEQVKLNIDNAFARQQGYALELRKSDYKRRIAVLDRFEQVFRASEEKI
ncbi:MAG: aldehyde dehydrogenase family protein, partial [Woeseiaceae bacterium]|nr:aldehyde dehydrogenase family protein [Woeseiaceae bacterium]